MSLDQEISLDDEYTPLTINVTNAQAGMRVTINVSTSGSNDPSVAWSSGPNFASAAGMQITSSTGTLPLAQLNVTSSSLTFITASGGGGSGALGFSCQLYLVGTPGISSFSLTAITDLNVLVTAAVNGALPQTVNTATNFIWPSS